MATCRHCERDFLGTPVELWDGNTYCQECIRRVSEDLQGRQLADGAISETLEPNEIRLWRFMRYMGGWYLALVIGFFGLPILIGGRNDPNLWSVIAFVLAFFGGFGLLLLLLSGAFQIRSTREKFPRTTTIEGDEFCVTDPEASRRTKLSVCEWYVGGTSCDLPLIFTRFRRSVLIRTPDERIACGLSPEMRNLWISYLRLARVRNTPPPRLFVATITIVLVMLIGGAAGFGVGKLLVQHDKDSPFFLAVLGAFDGLGLAVLFLFALVDGVNQAKRRLHPIVVCLAFCILAVKVTFGMSVPWQVRALIVIANAMIGLFAAMLCRRRIQAHSTRLGLIDRPAVSDVCSVERGG